MKNREYYGNLEAISPQAMRNSMGKESYFQLSPNHTLFRNDLGVYIFQIVECYVYFSE